MAPRATNRRRPLRLTSAGAAVALLLAVACTRGGPGGGPTSEPSGGRVASVAQSQARVLDKDTAPPGLRLLHLKPSDPTPGATAGWRGGWTTQSLVLSPGDQRQGWEWARSTADVYGTATDAAKAFGMTRDYVVSAYAGNARQADPGIGQQSVAIEATRNAPDVTVIWRDGNLVAQLAGYGGPPLTNDDIVALAQRLAASPLPG
jgi:hypothetical protein